jgi:Holliday junction resolvase RusA-like endonuclease
VSVNATLAIPTSWPEWKRLAALAGKIGPSGIPDASNILKSAEDALNGVVWIDDAQIVSVGMVKRYGKSPEVRIIVSGGFALPSQITRRPKEMDPDCGAHQ